MLLSEGVDVGNGVQCPWGRLLRVGVSVEAGRREVGSLWDIRIAQDEDLAVSHRRDSPASLASH